MFRASSCPSSEATTIAVAASGRGRAGWSDHDQQHCHHQAPTVNQRLLLQLLQLLMMGIRIPETCWAVFKWQVINLRICCIWLVDSIECFFFSQINTYCIRNHPNKCLSTTTYFTDIFNMNCFSWIWHSEDRASCYILIMKTNGMHCFSNLFDKVLYMFRTNPLVIIRSISTLHTRNRYLSC